MKRKFWLVIGPILLVFLGLAWWLAVRVNDDWGFWDANKIVLDVKPPLQEELVTIYCKTDIQLHENDSVLVWENGEMVAPLPQQSFSG